jgi:hypothetical protein
MSLALEEGQRKQAFRISTGPRKAKYLTLKEE